MGEPISQASSIPPEILQTPLKINSGGFGGSTGFDPTPETHGVEGTSGQPDSYQLTEEKGLILARPIYSPGFSGSTFACTPGGGVRNRGYWQDPPTPPPPPPSPSEQENKSEPSLPELCIEVGEAIERGNFSVANVQRQYGRIYFLMGEANSSFPLGFRADREADTLRLREVFNPAHPEEKLLCDKGYPLKEALHDRLGEEGVNLRNAVKRFFSGHAYLFEILRKDSQFLSVGQASLSELFDVVRFFDDSSPQDRMLIMDSDLGRGENRGNEEALKERFKNVVMESVKDEAKQVNYYAVYPHILELRRGEPPQWFFIVDSKTNKISYSDNAGPNRLIKVSN